MPARTDIKAENGNHSSPARMLLINAVICTLIALVLWLLIPAFRGYGFWRVFVHSQSIGNAIILAIIATEYFLRRQKIDARPLNVLIYLACTVAGLIIGMSFARWMLDIPGGPFGFLGDPQQLTVTLVVTVIASALINWYFSTQARVARLNLLASEEHRRAENARHAMLRAQIEPHMLFNTLANLRALITTDPTRAVDMLDRLDVFMRATLSGSQSSTTTLNQEFAMLENYLELMKIRFGDRLDYSVSLADDCLQLEIPALLLQPVVENAIRHGIEPSVNGGTIGISAKTNGHTLVLSVIDTGVGMGPNSDNRRDGFGLQNLKARIESSYDGRGRVDIESPFPSSLLSSQSDSSPGTPIVGTHVSIHIPTQGALQ